MWLKHGMATACAGLFAAIAIHSASAYSASVRGDVNQWKATVPSLGYGIHTSVYDNNLFPSDLPSKLKAAGATALRFPGGSYADDYHWQTNTYTPGYAIYINSSDTFDNFMTKDVTPSGVGAIITVNYGSNAAGTGGGDPNEAAAWVQYANITKGYGIQYWEIGNEVGGNGYAGDPGYERDLHYPYNGQRTGQAALSPTAYGENVLAYISAMKAKDSTIKIGVGVSTPGSTYNHDLLTQCGSKIDFVIVHWYPGGDAAGALASSTQIAGLVASLRSDFAKYCGSNAANIQILITETNAGTGAGVGAPQAMFAADDYLTWFENGSLNVDWLELHSGFLSEGVSGLPDDTPAEAYYGMQIDSLVARVGDNLDGTTSDNTLVSAHVVNRYDNTVGIELINKDPSNSATITVTLDNVTLGSSGTRYDFGTANFPAGSGWASSGIATSTLTGIKQNSFTVTVPAYTISAFVIPKTTVQDFSMAPTNASLTASQGGSASTTIKVAAFNGFTGSVTFSASGLPTGVTAAFSPTASTSSSTLKLTASASAKTGMYPLTVTGNNGSLTHTTTVVLAVVQSAAYVANGTYVLVNLSSGKSADDPAYSTAAGTQIDQYTIGGGSNQKWTLTNLGNNFVELVNGASGLALSVTSALAAKGAAIDQETYTGSAGQQWLISPAATSGYYLLQNPSSGLALDVPGASTANGIVLDQWATNGNGNQQWKFQ